MMNNFPKRLSGASFSLLVKYHVVHNSWIFFNCLYSQKVVTRYRIICIFVVNVTYGRVVSSLFFFLIYPFHIRKKANSANNYTRKYKSSNTAQQPPQGHYNEYEIHLFNVGISKAKEILRNLEKIEEIWPNRNTTL